MKKTLAMILAGGRGSRLHPLTEHRTKPAVPFGGVYQIIDFTLSNCINSNLRKIMLMTQYKSSSLTRHLNSAWNIFTRDLGEFIEVLPPQKRVGDVWYRGTADAVFQNLYHLEAHQPEQVLVLGGDHIYKMNYETMIQEHREQNADATIAVIDVPKHQATDFGVLQVNQAFEIVGFQEKPENPEPIPNNPERCLVSMGLYCFDHDPLVHQLKNHDGNPDYTHDFGRDILPAMVEGGEAVYAHQFDDQNRGDERYWRDVGTLESYYEANMDLVAVSPEFNLYDRDWPIRTFHPQYPPAKFVFDDDGCRGMAVDSMVSHGVILSGAKVTRSVLSPGVHVGRGATVENSILMDDVRIGAGAHVENTILDKRSRIPEDTVLGKDPSSDAEDHYVTDQGLTVVRRNFPDKRGEIFENHD